MPTPDAAVKTGVLAWLSACLLLGAPVAAAAQQPGQAPQSLRIEAAVDLALKNYPSIRVAAGQEGAARAGIDVVRTSYLPRTDLLWQQNRATRNNVAGLLLPQGVIPSISGPVSAAAYEGSWGSAGGLLLSWEAFDFGLRRAQVGVAESLVKQAIAGVELTRLQVAVAAADAFLSALAADQAVRAAQANVERLQVLNRSVSTLVQNQLRPGADLSRADAELAAARIQLIQSQRAVAVARATLAEAVGLAGDSVVPDAGSLVERIPAATDATAKPEIHPLAQAQEAALGTVRSREQALERSYVPRVSFQTTLFARGAAAPGLTVPGGDGLFPDTSNWAAGLTLTFPVFDIFGLRARRRVELGNESAEQARYVQVVQTLRAQDARARAQLEASRLIAENTPIELNAAQEAETRARSRYGAGLAPLTELADAQRLLAQAEIDDALSRVAVWQALLAESAARGDLTPFLQQVR